MRTFLFLSGSILGLTAPAFAQDAAPPADEPLVLVVSLEHGIILSIIGVGVQCLSCRPVDVLAFSKSIKQGLVLSQHRYDTGLLLCYVTRHKPVPILRHEAPTNLRTPIGTIYDGTVMRYVL